MKKFVTDWSVIRVQMLQNIIDDAGFSAEAKAEAKAELDRRTTFINVVDYDQISDEVYYTIVDFVAKSPDFNVAQCWKWSRGEAVVLVQEPSVHCKLPQCIVKVDGKEPLQLPMYGGIIEALAPIGIIASTNPNSHIWF